MLCAEQVIAIADEDGGMPAVRIQQRFGIHSIFFSAAALVFLQNGFRRNTIGTQQFGAGIRFRAGAIARFAARADDDRGESLLPQMHRVE